MKALQEEEQLLIFKIGQVMCCVSVRDVESVVNARPTSPVPNQPDFFAGVFEYRNETVSVLNLYKKFNYPVPEDPEHGVFIMAFTHRGIVAYWVDAIIDITSDCGAHWSEPPLFVTGNVFEKSLIWQDKLVLKTDFDKLFNMNDAKPLHQWVKENSDITQFDEQITSTQANESITRNDLGPLTDISLPETTIDLDETLADPATSQSVAVDATEHAALDALTSLELHAEQSVPVQNEHDSESSIIAENISQPSIVSDLSSQVDEVDQDSVLASHEESLADSTTSQNTKVDTIAEVGLDALTSLELHAEHSVPVQNEHDSESSIIAENISQPSIVSERSSQRHEVDQESLQIATDRENDQLQNDKIESIKRSTETLSNIDLGPMTLLSTIYTEAEIPENPTDTAKSKSAENAHLSSKKIERSKASHKESSAPHQKFDNTSFELSLTELEAEDALAERDLDEIATSEKLSRTSSSLVQKDESITKSSAQSEEPKKGQVEHKRKIRRPERSSERSSGIKSGTSIFTSSEIVDSFPRRKIKTNDVFNVDSNRTSKTVYDSIKLYLEPDSQQKQWRNGSNVHKESTDIVNAFDGNAAFDVEKLFEEKIADKVREYFDSVDEQKRTQVKLVVSEEKLASEAITEIAPHMKETPDDDPVLDSEYLDIPEEELRAKREASVLKVIDRIQKNNPPANSTRGLRLLASLLLVSIVLFTLLRFDILPNGDSEKPVNTLHLLHEENQASLPGVKENVPTSESSLPTTETVKPAPVSTYQSENAPLPSVEPARQIAPETPIKSDVTNPEHTSALGGKALSGSTLPPSPVVKWYTHVVVKGDTLWHIADIFLNDPFRYIDLAQWNHIKNPDLIFPGNKVNYNREASKEKISNDNL